ncbi:hypothetical protein A4U49_09580 [Acidithiobacillus ferrivorans]|uniref:hypothetical protein n=1 Tax=Acidithiobacillus ferrivorans TaxID=160808 RepID=UPI000892AFE3|nr:hypothetical protein [Acidithiobacillus ferrivorans]OFA16004.1 hypothetical protein A4U49_09580 [Acidithiobacillus ferrivorans]
MSKIHIATQIPPHWADMESDLLILTGNGYPDLPRLIWALRQASKVRPDGPIIAMAGHRECTGWDMVQFSGVFRGLAQLSGRYIVSGYQHEITSKRLDARILACTLWDAAGRTAPGRDVGNPADISMRWKGCAMTLENRQMLRHQDVAWLKSMLDKKCTQQRTIVATHYGPDLVLLEQYQPNLWIFGGHNTPPLDVQIDTTRVLSHPFAEIEL